MIVTVLLTLVWSQGAALSAHRGQSSTAPQLFGTRGHSDAKFAFNQHVVLKEAEQSRRTEASLVPSRKKIACVVCARALPL